jgi:hypothetical protein
MNLLNQKVVNSAEVVVRAAISDLLSTRKQGAVVGVAPAGAGKSYTLGTAVAAAREDRRRVAVATPTNEQAFSLVRDLATRFPREKITFVPKADLDIPADVLARKNVEVRKAGNANASTLLVGTLSKFGDARGRGDLEPVDVLLVDEAFQASSVSYYCVGDLAPRHLLMGDSGQLAPFSNAPESDRWRGLGEDPLLTAIEVLRLNHPATKVHQLPVTRRLEPRAVEVVKSFYPDHTFEAAVLPGVRQLRFGSAASARTYRVEDAILDMAAKSGWTHHELPGEAVISSDPETIECIVRLLKRLFARDPIVQCKKNLKPRALRHEDVAVAVSHNEQKRLLRVALDACGMSGVHLNTANKLQGLTFEFVVAWHPLAGMLDVDDFHLDPGRLCVMNASSSGMRGHRSCGRSGARERNPARDAGICRLGPQPSARRLVCARRCFRRPGIPSSRVGGIRF